MTEDWGLLLSFLPCNWRDLAASTGALKGLRKNKSADNLLRVLLIHLGCGHSLHETVVRARQANLAELSAVALWRVHYSVCLPSLACDFFKLTETQGAGTGESFVHFPIRAGDYLLADRGYSTTAGRSSSSSSASNAYSYEFER